MSVLHVESDDEMGELLESMGDKILILKWGATWCGPCKQLAPHFDKLAQESKHPNLVFASADITECTEYAAECGVTSIPNVQFIQNDDIKYSQLGYDKDTISKLKNAIAKYLPSNNTV